MDREQWLALLREMKDKLANAGDELELQSLSELIPINFAIDHALPEFEEAYPERYYLQVNNQETGGQWWFVKDNEQPANVQLDDAGKFKSTRIAMIIDRITGIQGEGESYFKITVAR